MTIKYINPKVTILETTNFDNMLDIWIKSKNLAVQKLDNGKVKTGDEVVDYEDYEDRILKMGMQYTNFFNITFEITGSILFRDICYSINKSAQWATSLRFNHSSFDEIDPKFFPVSSEYKGIKEWENAFEIYLQKVKEIPNIDENRVYMPYSLCSTYWVQFNFKSLVSILSLMRLKMPFFFNIYGNLIIDEIRKDLGIDFSKYLTTYIDSGVGQYFFTKPYQGDSYKLESDTIILNKTMALVLYSQFLRQQDTIIKGLFDMVTHDDPKKFKHIVFLGNSLVKTRYTADIERFMRTISNRMCWFSQSQNYGYQSWSNILDLVLESSTYDELKKLLPCKIAYGKVCDCKYYDDLKFRKEKIEKGELVPCALFYRDENYLKERLSKDDSLIAKLYEDIFTKEIKSQS